MTLENVLAAIVLLLGVILWKVFEISSRLKKQFPTDEERDSEWARKDPMGHWEAHREETQPKEIKK